jgi:hypothetical protein
MKAKVFLFTLAIVFSGVLIFSSPAIAVTSNPQCVQGAKSARVDCVAACQESFRVAKDACRNVDHDCADACRAGYDTCIQNDPTLIALANCKAGCETSLEAAKTACREKYLQGTVERDACIDLEQIIAFTCRDECREDYNAAPAVKACRDQFRACIGSCPPATP